MYDPENNNFLTCEAEKEARKVAQEILDEYGEDATSYGWSARTGEICYGKILCTAVGHKIEPIKAECGERDFCAGCPRGDDGDPSEDELCQDYDIDCNGEEHLDYTLEPVSEPLPDVKAIVTAYLKDNGFDGLVNPGECSCLLDDLIACDNYTGFCKPGHKLLCNGCEDYNFCISVDDGGCPRIED